MKSAMEMNVHKEMEKEIKRLAGNDVALTNLTNLLKKRIAFAFRFLRHVRHAWFATLVGLEQSRQGPPNCIR